MSEFVELGQEFKVLDKGFIRLVDFMGSDDSVVQAARTSYGKGTKKVSEDRNLIRYLMRHRHTSPFEMCELKFHVKVPMDIWRQWIRHRTASVNEISTRYSEVPDDQFHFSSEFRTQSKTNKQCSGELISDEELANSLKYDETVVSKVSFETYKSMLESGVAREQARKLLPLGTYTEAYWKINLHNLLHFLALRMHEHSQLEIREFANIIGNEIVAKLFPVTWQAYRS